MASGPMEKWIIDKTGIKKGDIRELQNYQLEKIKGVISYVKKYSGFYKEHLNGIHEGNIDSFKEFEKIPFTLPEHIKQNSHKFLCVSQKDIARVVTLKSSGTSGEEKRIYFTEEDLQLTIEFFKYGISYLANKDDRIMILLPGNSYGSIGDLLKKALRELEIECYVEGVIKDLKSTAKFINDKNINCIVGIPIQLLQLSRTESETFKNNIEKILLSTDYVPETLIQELTNKFGCKVFTHYGMTEMGYGGGVECNELNGYHMREGDLYFEIINPNTGETVEPGQYGEVVFTTLTRKAMPLIRYRTGDIACFNLDSCKCGTFLRTMNRVMGRIDNRIKIEKGKFVYMRELDEIILSFQEIIDYKIYIKEDNIIFIELIVLKKESFFKWSDKIMRNIKSIPVIKEGLIKNIIEIVLIYSIEYVKIENSITKRKVYDYRRRS